MLIDLHVHTTQGSADSTLTPQQVVEEATRIGLQGVCLTEHSGVRDRGLWDRLELRRLRGKQKGLLLVRALEVETDMGHITVFGLDEYTHGPWKAEKLRAAADKEGAFMVAAHPLRYLYSQDPDKPNLLFPALTASPLTVEEAAEHPLFELVDAIEAANGGNTDDENAFALKLAHYLGKPAVGGSDSHAQYELGRRVTVFPEPIGSEQEFLEALRAGNYYPATGLRTGKVRPFPSPGK